MSLSSRTAAGRGPLLAHVFPTFDVGGAQTRLVTLANHFGGALRHVVIAMDGRYDCAERFSPNVDVTLRRYPVRKGGLFGNRHTFRQALENIRPDTLITHNWGSIEWVVANWPRVAPHIHIEDGFGRDEAKGQMRRRIWARRALLRASRVVVPSRTLQRIAHDVWRLPDACIRYIPNGIDCARFAASPDPTLIRQWPGEGLVVGTVASLRAEKNVERLVRAFAEVAADVPCRLVIVGEGAERERLQKLAADLAVASCVFFTGNILGSERVYGGYDIFALTSDTEQMPLTILEAMAAARPIVATDVGDIRSMVAPENHPYLTACDHTAVAKALRQMLLDTDLRARLGRANRNRVLAEYDQARMFTAFADLYGLR